MVRKIKLKEFLLVLVGAVLMIGLDFGLFRDHTKDAEKIIETVTEIVSKGGILELGKSDELVQIEEPVNDLFDQEDIKTIEEVDGGEIKGFTGHGSFYRTDTYEHFVEDTRNKCVSEGNPYGAQCVSLAQAFWTNYAGYGLDLCGTGAARGIWSCKEKNADDSFVMITNPADIQPGDWIITNGGTWGHVAMAVGYYNNGYIAVYGENQGGKICGEGGSQPNVINLSMKTFLGAFRPKDYIITEPVPEAPDGGIMK